MVGVGHHEDLEHVSPRPNLNDDPATFGVDIRVLAAGAPTTSTTPYPAGRTIVWSSV